jgi:hypothetical protein
VQTDPRKPSFNATGLVQLKNWRGIRAQNGGTYKYAVTSGSIIAEPQLPKGYPELTSGSSPDLAQQRLRAVETKKSGGLRVECHFAGMTLVPSAPSTINSQLDQLQASSRRLPQISVHFLQPLPRNL